MEHVSSTLYLAMSAYLERENYTGMANWLRIQSEEERSHMLLLIDYLLDRNGTVIIKEVPSQPSEFGTPQETFQKVLEHEQYVTNAYRQAYDYVQQMDSLTIDIIQQFLREQVEEVSQSQTILNRMQLAAGIPAAILLLDQELGQRQPADGTTLG